MDSARCSGSDEKIPSAPGTNQVAGFVEFCALTGPRKFIELDIIMSILSEETPINRFLNNTEFIILRILRCQKFWLPSLLTWSEAQSYLFLTKYA